MAINTILNINIAAEFYIIQLLLISNLTIYFIMLILDTDDYLKILIFLKLSYY